MLYQANKKVPGGKLIRVKLEADAEINAVRINGDFFLHPEDSLPEIEKNLAGLPIDTEESALAQKIHEALARENAAFMGVTPEDIAQTMVEAMRNSTAIPKMTVTAIGGDASGSAANASTPVAAENMPSPETAQM